MAHFCKEFTQSRKLSRKSVLITAKLGQKSVKTHHSDTFLYASSSCLNSSVFVNPQHFRSGQKPLYAHSRTIFSAMIGSTRQIASFTFFHASTVSLWAQEQRRFLDTLMSAWALALNIMSFRLPCGRSSLEQSSFRLSSRCEWTKGMKPSQWRTMWTVTHCLMPSIFTSYSTNRMGECSHRSILRFHASEGSDLVSLPSVARAASYALLHPVTCFAFTFIIFRFCYSFY